MTRAIRLSCALWLLLPEASMAQAAARPARLPALPDSSGWGVHVLTARQDRSGGVWVGTYGEGIYYLAPDSSRWQNFRSDTAGASISWDLDRKSVV